MILYFYVRNIFLWRNEQNRKDRSLVSLKCCSNVNYRCNRCVQIKLCIFQTRTTRLDLNIVFYALGPLDHKSLYL
jgi:hypothetical protein